MTKITTRQKREREKRKQARWGRKYKEFLKAKALLLGYEYVEWGHAYIANGKTPGAYALNVDTLEKEAASVSTREMRFADGLRKFKEENHRGRTG